jgi:Tol biopolymer transport system component
MMNAAGTRFGVTLGSGLMNTELIDASGQLDTICPVDTESGHGATPAQPCDNAVISADGSAIAFRTAYPSLVDGDTNGFVDDFVYNATSAQIVRASINADGSQGNGDVDVANGFSFAGNFALSSDGNLLAFNSGNATNLGGSDLPKQLLLVKNLTTGDIDVAGTATDDSGTPVPSQWNTYGPQFDGGASLLVFQSQTTGEQLDIRVRAMETGQVRSLCRGQSGNAADNGCRSVAISADGHWAAFASGSTDIAPYPVAPSFVEQDVYLVNIDEVFDDIFADGFEH